MKISYLTGPGQVGKRDYLRRLKKKYSEDNIITIDLKTDSLEKLSVSLVSVSLFGDSNRLVVVENPPETLALGTPLPDDPNLFLVILTDSLTRLPKISTATVIAFEGDKETTAFGLIDAVLEGRKPAALIEVEKLLNQHGGIYLLSMIFYGLRRNLLPLPESLFTKNKIIRQKPNFQPESWAPMYNLVLQTDWKLKTGQVSEALGLERLVVGLSDFYSRQ